MIQVRAIFIGLGLLVSLTAFGQYTKQEVEVGFGPMFSVAKRSVPTQFVGADGSGFYVVYSRGKLGDGRRYLHKFGYDLEPKQSIKLSSKIGSVNTRSQRVIMLDGKLYQIAQATSGNQRSFYVQAISPDDLSTIKTEFIGNIRSQGRDVSRSRTFISISRDSAYVTLAYTIPNQAKDNESFVVNVFDKQMNQLRTEQYSFPYENRLLDLQEFRVDEQGNVYALGKRNFNSQRDRVGGLANYEYILFNLGNEGEVTETRMDGQGRFLTDMKVQITPDGDIVSAGFYSDFNTNGAGGAYYLRMDGETKAVISSSFKAFDIDFMVQNMTERKAERVQRRLREGRQRNELPHYDIDELIAMPDGSVRMIGEQRLEFTTSYGAGDSFIIQTHYHYDDMVVVSISPNGEIDWAQRIAKRQRTVDDRAAFSSYALMVRDNDLSLYFNDNANNLDYNGVGRIALMAKNANTVVMSAQVGQFGDVKRSGLFRRGEANIRIRPVFAHQLDEDEMLIFGHRELRNQRFVLLKYK